MNAFGGPATILVLSQNTKRESGKNVQLGNITAGKAVADIVRSCLGPKAMLKMLMDPTGGIVMTNDGNAILREITVQHPAAKSLIEIARTQDEEVGDGTTTVIVLAGAMLMTAEPFLLKNIHPTVIIRGYRQALEDITHFLRDKISIQIDASDEKQLANVVSTCIGTKIFGHWSELATNLALQAVRNAAIIQPDGSVDIDLKRSVRVERIPGGAIEDSHIIRGVILNKDVTHSNMRRCIIKPRIVLLDSPLEYKKGESMTNIEISGEDDFTKILELEEEFVRTQCADILKVKPDIVFTEKGISDLASHILFKAGVSAVRRLKKTDNNRLANACGARIVNRTDELNEADVGTLAGKFEVKKIGDEQYCFVTECLGTGACTVLLRGPSKDILQELDRNLHDALHVARCVTMEPRLVPGGGATEMALVRLLTDRANSLQGTEQGLYRAVASALEIIPCTLALNCGVNPLKILTALKAKHSENDAFQTWGIDGMDGQLKDMADVKIFDPLSVKLQAYKTAVETAILLLRIDDIVSGSKKKKDDETGPKTAPPADDKE